MMMAIMKMTNAMMNLKMANMKMNISQIQTQI